MKLRNLMPAAAVAAIMAVAPMPAQAVTMVIFKGAMPISGFGLTRDIDAALAKIIASGDRLNATLDAVAQAAKDRSQATDRLVASDGSAPPVVVENVFTVFANDVYVSIDNLSDGSFASRLATSAEIDHFRSEQIGGDVTAVPEPATWAMMLTGLGMVAGAARYRRRRTVTTYA